MAALGMLLRRSLQLVPQNLRQGKIQQTIVRYETTSPTGAMMSNPPKSRLGLTKVIVVAFPFIYIGATMSKEGAAFLEENDIFVPDDDDD
ncbi:essential MCU regulator, mitochondrial-like [Glandiceps talaboti]